MDELQFLTWVRGTGLNLAISIFLLGVFVRLFEIYSLGSQERFVRTTKCWRALPA